MTDAVSRPTKMKLWINREGIDFANCHDIKPTQELNIPLDATGDFRIVVKPALFLNTSSLTILLEEPEDP